MSTPELNLASMSLLTLEKLIQNAQQEIIKKQEEVTSKYGDWFCGIIGKEIIFKLPEVKAEALKLHEDRKYPSNKTKPSMLGSYSAVRGMLSYDRPFIAIKIEAKDVINKKLIGVFVEVIFTRFTEKSTGNYVTALCNAAEDGTTHASFLYGTGGMSQQQIEAVRDLLLGKTIPAPTSPTLYEIKMV